MSPCTRSAGVWKHGRLAQRESQKLRGPWKPGCGHATPPRGLAGDCLTCSLQGLRGSKGAGLLLHFARWELASAPPTMSIYTWIAQEPLITLVNGQERGGA